MKIVFSTLFVLIVAAICGTWFWTIPRCLESGVGTRGYSGTARSVSDDEGVLGCWWGGLTHERRRAQAFEEWAREGERLERDRRAGRRR
jgi:hypothetical protein